MEDMMEAESALHWDLVAKGVQLHLKLAAKTSHLNFERLSSRLPAPFYSGCLFAITRAKHWPRLRRLIYIGGAPLIREARLWRTLRHLRRSAKQGNLLPWILPTLGIGLVASAAGEMIGHLLGVGNAKE